LFEEGVEKLVRERCSFEVYGGTYFDEWGEFNLGLGFMPVVGIDLMPFSPAKSICHTLRNIYQAMKSRVAMSYTPEMLARIKQARQEKTANKTREFKHERRGEVLRHAIRRRTKGPPVHGYLDSVARSTSVSLSEVWYVGIAREAVHEGT
jgi:hypothetical protein